ncbi:sensor histidine kinase [Oceanobacillus alkalisoli]|uniref:sensor histidine kinase n=1 Tax=Oceanobacillus alkalisoli TaxID=2925113 RepID=UPI001EEFDFAC|nr:ATP-binding protein [Oceanobacillus alkalisoli]MCF3942283.1 ATP-binding protein [Oceanobacillus alkalisoli]MCG5104519.1 ATP-binding protein [Oceanobacillus alkalisoli]
MFNKLSLKIGMLFFVFILIIETFLYSILYTNLANERIEEVMDNLLARGNTHSDVLEEHFNQTTLEHVAIMESESDFAVVITDASGFVIVHSDPIDEEMLEVIKHTDTHQIPTDGKVIEERWMEKDYIATDSPITINEEHQGHVFMFADTDNIKRIVDHLSDQFLIIGFITIILTIITVFILSRLITKPLIEITKATEQLSKGRNRVELQTDRSDELGELANSITTLSNDLEHMKKERNEFLASISHELRTPLTYIKGYADIISRDDITDDEKSEYLEIIREETEQLTVLVRNLFNLAKMDQNTFGINRQNIEFGKLIYTITERIRPALEEKNIIFLVSCPSNIIANIDPDRMQQVLLNILDNAKKHTSEGKRISVEVYQNKHNIKTIISDEGEGIPEEDLPYIFERLYRVEKSRSRLSGGTGLGLAIAKEIVESHGGSIEVNSKIGEGTSFEIILQRGEHIE